MPKRIVDLNPGPLKRSYEVVVIGGGVHGLSVAYNLAKSGRRDVVVLEQAYIGAGASGRNLASTRCNYGNPAWTRLFWEATKIWGTISLELDVNIMFTRRGYVLCFASEEIAEQVKAALPFQHSLGIPSEYVTADRVRELAPPVDTSKIVGASYDPTSGTTRHDALVWGYAGAASRLGAEIHNGVTVTGIKVERDGIAGVETSAGDISTRIVVNAAGYGSHEIGQLAGVDVPTRMLPLEMFVSESYEPFLDPITSFLEPQLYTVQTSRGEFVLGAEMPGAHGDQLTTTYRWMRHAARTWATYLPPLAGISIARSWVGLVDMSADGAGLLGASSEREGFYVDCGWGGYGYMASPVTGRYMAELINTGSLDPIAQPFHFERFVNDKPIPESLTAVDHAGDTREVQL